MDKLYIIVEYGRTSELWFATSKQVPGVEGSGEEIHDALSDFYDKATTKNPSLTHVPVSITVLDPNES